VVSTGTGATLHGVLQTAAASHDKQPLVTAKHARAKSIRPTAVVTSGMAWGLTSRPDCKGVHASRD
jgi:hypothetical protein